MVGDGHGLWLRVRTSGSKVFVVRKKIANKTRVITLGNYPALTLQEARRRTFSPATLDPGADISVEALCNEFFDRKISISYRRPHHIRGYLDRIIERFGKAKARAVTQRELADFLKTYSKRGRVAANRLLSIVRQVFLYAQKSGYLNSNPAQLLDRDVAGGEEKARNRILSDREIRLLGLMPPPHGPLLRFLLLTGQRIGETQKARPADIRHGIWKIPAENAKNGRAHLVHLSPAAQAILGALAPNREFLFGITTDTGVQAFLRRWCDRHQIAPRFTPHDLRRTAATRMHGLGVAPHVVERILNHTLQGVMAVYNHAEYLDERRAAMLIWDAELQRIMNEAQDGSVAI